MLDGYKTYIVAIGLVLIVIIEKLIGFDVPGVDLGHDWLLVLMNALGLGTLRAGISSTR